MAQIGGRAFVVAVFRFLAQGIVWREAIGQEDDWDDAEEKRYGDPISNA